MKKLIFFLSFLFSMHQASARIKTMPIHWGPVEKIEKIADLPDTPAYQLNNGKYMDLGYRYTVYEVLWLPLFVKSRGTLVGYIDDHNFIELSEEEISMILSENNLNISPGKINVPLWDRIGGKIVFAALMLIIFGFIAKESRVRKLKLQKVKAR